jgi:hypothetical protein
VHKKRKEFNTVGNYTSLGYLLLRKVADSLSKEKIREILKDDKIASDKTHPMEFYIYPYESKYYSAGQILVKRSKYYVILTPSCDLVFSDDGKREVKAKKVLLAEATPLESHDIYNKYLKNKEKQKDSLAALIEARKGDRYFFLPRTPFIENLVIDFQNKLTVSYDALKQYNKLAKLDDPFAQAMLSSFTRYYNRIGFPDIDSQFVIENLGLTESH